tara:strand:+ start:5388 stop:5675 length:288 start_codon:yes stop_codon:yes gene_type:complete
MASDVLATLRQKINDVDDAIFDLLKERAKIAKQIGVYKKSHHIPVRDLKREEQHAEAIQHRYPELGSDLIQSILHAMIQDAVRIQEDKLKFDAVD